MPVVNDDCRNLFAALAQRFQLLRKATMGEPQALDHLHGVTASFLIRPPETMQPLVVVFFPHEDEQWHEAARETFDFEGECWRRWAQATRGTATDFKPFRRHQPPPVWTGLEEQRDAEGRFLVGRHEAAISRLGRQRTYPVLLRPYVPWRSIGVTGALRPMRQSIATLVNAIVPATVRRPIDQALNELDGSHLLASDSYLVPTRWRTFHRTYFGLGLSREERMRRGSPPLVA